MIDFLSKYRLALTLGLLLVLVTAFSWLLISRQSLKTELAEVRGNLEVCGLANAQMATQVKAQNEAIDKYRQQVTEKEKIVAEAIKTAAEASRQYSDRSRRIMAIKPATDDLCKATSELFKDYISKRKP